MSKTNRGIDRVLIGHASDFEAATGVTVILCPNAMTPGIDMRGSATSTRQIDSLFSHHIVPKVHAICLTGGSAYGLDAGAGVMKYLEEKGYGYAGRDARIPIVPTAAVYDLGIGRSDVRPAATLGYEACLNATADPIKEGSIGAGTGATVGKFYGIEQAMKGGVGRAVRKLKHRLIVKTLVVVNAFGDVWDPFNTEILAGARKSRQGRAFADTSKLYRQGVKRPAPTFQNTTLGVIITNARLDKTSAGLVARLGQNGLTKAIRPAHTLYDGDIVFTLASGQIEVDPHTVGVLAEDALIESVMRSVTEAESLGGVPCYSGIVTTRR